MKLRLNGLINDNFEDAIVRIFNQKQYVVGTGFLVAPGYVLTCAHVVLQAILVQEERNGEEEEDYYRKQTTRPEQTISLDFPILASDQPIHAKVVDWVSYDMETGDIAVLQILTPELVAAKPLRLAEVECSDVENEQHFVYGFAERNTCDRSDSYRPKCKVAGGRFQLRKLDNLDSVTIRPGFSGAPVWNDKRKFVIGMIATASAEQETAQAIPTQVLQPILKKTKARCLDDALTQSLNSCENDQDRHFLNLAIKKALRYCNPNGVDCPRLDQLIDLSIDRAPAEGWEIEGRLVQFAMMLVQMDGIRVKTFDLLRKWVEEACHLDFPVLLTRIHREMKEKQISSSTIYQHLMVVVEETEVLIDELRVSIWPVSDRDSYNPNNPPLATVADKVLGIDELPAFIREQMRDFRNPTPTIHLFLPRKLFDCDIEMRSCGSKVDVLGSKYEFVIRTNLKAHGIRYSYYDDWIIKWQTIEAALDQQTSQLFKPVDCSQPETNLIREIAKINAAMLKNLHSLESIGELFDSIGNEDVALPVAIWSRNSQFQDNLSEVLDCVVKTLRGRVLRERNAAHESPAENLLGHHLSLLWEDPKVLPPGMLDVDQNGMLRL